MKPKKNKKKIADSEGSAGTDHEREKYASKGNPRRMRKTVWVRGETNPSGIATWDISLEERPQMIVNNSQIAGPAQTDDEKTSEADDKETPWIPGESYVPSKVRKLSHYLKDHQSPKVKRFELVHLGMERI